MLSNGYVPEFNDLKILNMDKISTLSRFYYDNFLNIITRLYNYHYGKIIETGYLDFYDKEQKRRYFTNNK